MIYKILQSKGARLLQKSLGGHRRQIWRSRIVQAVSVLAVAALGAYLLGSGHAATTVPSIEAESGTISDDAGVTTDSSASGGSAVIFGAGVTPTNLQAFTGGNSIALVWDMPSGTVQNVQVWRNNQQVATITPNSSSPIQNVELGKEYDDSSVTAGSTYQYKVRAVSSSGVVSAFTSTVTATQPKTSMSVPNITVTASQYPSLSTFMTTYIVPLLKTWYPKVSDEIAYPSYTPPTSFTINFSTSVGSSGDVCYTSASGGTATISCDPNWLTDNMSVPDNDVAAVFVHESTHVIQDGFPNDTTGWATEGGASWASDFFARQNINDFTPYLDDPNEQGPASYTPGAFFIDFIRNNYDASFPEKLNVALHNNTYSSSLIPNETGGLSVSQVWQQAISDYNGPVAAITGIGGKCLEVQNGTVANGTKIVLDSCNSSTKQQWALHYHNTAKTGVFEITSPTLGNVTGTDYCIDDSYSGTADGTNMQYWGCDQTNAQFWKLGRNGTVVNVNSGTCLATAGGSSANGTQVIIRACDGAADEQWAGL